MSRPLGLAVVLLLDLRGRARGRVRVTIRVTGSDGRVYRDTRSYRTCAKKK